ncbi:MAG: ABC transporter ATP-binding protein [Cytophagales bacterium]|nr:ABC transporter ATP-binding protein [Cytophagales bacterium]
MLLRLTNIRKSFGLSGSRSYREVLRGISFELDSGKSLAILGPSGSGKSTLLNIIGALDIPDEGQIAFGGEAIERFSEKQLASFRNREIGFVFQSHHLLPQCNVIENVLVPTLANNAKKLRAEVKHNALDLIRTVGLWEHRFDFPGTLSGGECQRVAAIRALINRPRLLLADEPTGALDHEHATSIINLLLKLKDEFGTSLIVVTHSRDIASRMDQMYNLTGGELQRLSK